MCFFLNTSKCNIIEGCLLDVLNERNIQLANTKHVFFNIISENQDNILYTLFPICVLFDAFK